MEENQNDSRVQEREAIKDEDYFMAVALLSAQRSKDPNTQVGACIVCQENHEKKTIVGVGYNKMPDRCDGAFPWDRKEGTAGGIHLDTKYPYVCHAELNAILSSTPKSVAGCSIYVTLFPCNECAKLIIQSDIKEVIYLADKYPETNETIASKRMLDKANVKCRIFPQRDKIELNFQV